jgi:probable F420-dependent oxidoreductase
MQVGIHLPQFGRASGPESIARAAVLAEELGFAGLWVSDHIVQPASQGYPSPYLYEPLLTLAYAAAVTERIGLGTSVLVAPQRNPLETANALASLDSLSEGRLTVGVGLGWSAGEFEALQQPFTERGRRTEEIVTLWRAVWEDDPASFDGAFYGFSDIRVLPKPAHRVPIWVGGTSPVALQRAARVGDGSHLIGKSPEEAAELVAALRRLRPEPEFVISLRTGWDPQGMESGRIRREHEGYASLGIGHVVAAPWRNDLEDWLRSMELLARLVELTPA